VAHLVRISAIHEPGGVLVKVPERNVGAQVFFRQCGFRVAKVLSGLLRDFQDVHVMKRSLPEWAFPDFDIGVPEDELIPFWAVKHAWPLRGMRIKGAVEPFPAAQRLQPGRTP